MKFTTFLKVFAISLAVFVGACGIGVGILAIAGYFSTPQIMPQDLAFDQVEYNVDDDFTITISTTTQDVSETTLTLSLQNGNIITTSDGSVRISDGVISIPQTATIGVPFNVYVETTVHDAECNGEEWITGGHSIITATSQNQQIDSISANVNVDVPVYRVELETRVSSQDENSDVFAVGSSVSTNLKFYPARSAYQYSHDGTDGGEVVYKNTYFMAASSTDENITQQGHTNVFTTSRIGTSTIVGYVFASTPIEERVLLGYQGLDEDAKFAAVLARLEQLASDTLDSDRQAYRANKTIDIVEVTVDSMRLDGGMGNVKVDTLFTLYANNSNIAQASSRSSLGIRLYSSLDQSISLQHELNNVAIRFLYRVGNTYYDAVNNENSAYNVVTIPSYGYGETRQVLVNGATFTYYFPVITSSIDEYYWQFAVTSNVDSNNLCIEVRYFGETAENVEPISVNFSTNSVQDNSIYWSTTNQTLTIIDGETPNLNSLDVKTFAVVPNENLYQRRAYFVVESSDISVEDMIVTTGEAVEYQLGSQTVRLYEIEDGIIQPRTTQAYGRTFDVVFMTIQTDYQGNPKLDEQGRYVIQRYSQDSLNAISTLEVYVNKTLYNLTSNIQTVLTNDELIINAETNDIAYVHNTTAPFEVVLGYSLPASAGQSEQTNEQLIFRNAVLNGEIDIIAKIQDTDSETSIIYSTSSSEQNNGNEFVFSMNIGSLPNNVSARRIKLYVVYDNAAFSTPREDAISTYNDGQQFECIEVYDGSAEIFDFNVNLVEDGAYKSDPENRILVTSDIQSENGYINNIQTTYNYRGNEISEFLFESNGQQIDYSALAVVLEDKYGKKPISSEYVFESSNVSILNIANGILTFNGTGDVELYLKDAEGVIQDTLYFTCQQNGYISQVDQLLERYSGSTASKSSVVVYTYSDRAYDFAPISVQLVGYAGSTISLKSTMAGVVNLISYTYTYNDGQALLTQLMNFSLVNEQDASTLDGFVEFGGQFNNLTYLTILKDFGKPYSLQLRVTVAALGISQVITLNIARDLYLSVDSYGNDYEDEPISIVGNVSYQGVYADSLYQVRIQLNYTIGSGSPDFTLDTSKYSLYIYEYDENGQQIGNRTLVTNSDTPSSIAYIASYTSSTDVQIDNGIGIGREDGSKLTYVYNAYIVFKSFNENNGYRRVMLSLEKNDEQNTAIDALGSLYLYINPNIRVKQDVTDLALDIANSQVDDISYYGRAVLLDNSEQSPLMVYRVVDNSGEVQNISFELDYSKIGFKFVNEEDSNRFYIAREGDGFVLYSLANINNSISLKIILTYDGVDVLTNDGKTYEMQFNLSPNITRNPDSTMWVLYKGEYYLKLVNGEQYTFETILQAFSIKSYGIIDVTPNLDIQSTNNIVVQGQSISIQGVNNNIIDSSFAAIYLNNAIDGRGDSITFKILLLPFDIPYVIYPNTTGEYDLFNLLNIDWVITEELYYTLEGAGLEGTDLLIEEDEVITDGVYGIKYVPGMQLTVRNLDSNDKNIYARFEGTNFITEPVGRDTFVIIEARLNLATNSLVIPYLVQIKKVLDIRTYYPYMTTYSQNSNVSGSDLYSDIDNVTFDMEYLEFNQEGNATIDMLEVFDDTIPNSTNSTSRVVIGRNDNGVFTEQENLPSAVLTFTISEVAYYFFRWETAQNVNQYATIGSGIHGNSVININRDGAQYLRVKVLMTTQNGLEAYYYISVGEIPNLNFTQRTDEGVSSPDIQDISLPAGEGKEIELTGRYNLTMSLNSSSSSTTDANHLLSYYVVPSHIEGHYAWVDYESMTLNAEDTTENWNTQFVFYTKFGALDIVNLYILSNYSIELIDENTSLKYNSAFNIYEVDSGNIIDINNTFKVIKDDGQSEFTTFDEININILTPIEDEIISSTEIDGNDILRVGLVTQDTYVDVLIVFIFTDNGEQVTYNLSMRLRINAIFNVGVINDQPITQMNMLPVTGVSAGSINNLDILAQLFNYTGEADFDLWYQNVIDNNLGSLNVELITQNVFGNFSGQIIQTEDQHYIIELDVSEVAEQTNLAFRISYYNYGSSDDTTFVMASYFNLTLNPNFRIIVNYPTPNTSTISVAESYWFDRSEDAQNTISLNQEADLADATRIVVENLNDQTYEDDIVVRVGLGAEYVYVDNALVGDNYYPLNTDFVISEDQNHSINDNLSLQFGLYYQIIGSQNIYIPVGVYNVVLFNNVYEMLGYNFNSANSTNNLNQPENIYIGTNDDILTKITLTLTVPQDAVLTIDKYLRVTQINGVTAESSYVHLSDGMQGDSIPVYVTLLDLTVSDMSNFVSSDEGVTWAVYQMDAEGQYIQSALTNSEGLSILDKIEVVFESRIQLMYRTVTTFDSQGGMATVSNQNIDFFKVYELLSGTGCSLQEEDITEEREIRKAISINSRNGNSLNEGIEIGTYYILYGFDIEFDTTNIELSTGQNTSILHNGTRGDPDISSSVNYMSLLNMKRTSDKSYYTATDFSSDGLQLSIAADSVTNTATNSQYQNLIHSNTSYLRFTPAMNENGVIYDFNFVAMGSPRETSVTVNLVLTISYGSINKEFTLTFIVSHDYTSETLRNADGTLNSETSRSIIKENFDRFITFAIWGSQTVNENYIFIQHENENQNQAGNIASMFQVSFIQGGQYVTQRPTSSGNYDLAFRFADIAFGNKNVDIVLTDEFGYTITYYVTIVARYNALFTTSLITAFERDTIGLVDKTSQPGNYDHIVSVSFEKRETGIPDFLLTDLDNWEAIFSYNNASGSVTTISYPLVLASDQFYFEIDFIDSLEFSNRVIAGTLTLRSTSNENYEVAVDIPMTIRERYSLVSSDTPYVRDGVAFSLLDVIDVKDNSQNYVVGDRSIKDSYSIYLGFSIKDDEGNELSLDDVSRVLSLRIRAYDVRANEYLFATVPYDIENGYLSIDELFGFEDISNYQFRIEYSITEYEYNDEHLSINNTTTDEAFYYTNSNATQSIYNISYETGNGYKDESNVVTFKNSFYDGLDGSKFPETGSDGKPMWPEYTIQITQCYIIEDQTLTIGLRQLDNNSQLTVYFVNQENHSEIRRANISSDQNKLATFSLSELNVIDTARGEKVSLLTNSEKTIVDGLSVSQLANLKGVQFTNSGNDDYIGSSYNLTKYIAPDAEFIKSSDGLNIDFVNDSLQIDVSYAFEDGVAKKQYLDYQAPVWITLKYIDVDSTLAYGAGTQRNAQLPVDYLQNGIPIENWAGTTYRPFELIAGYTTATSFVVSDDSTLSGNVQDLEFAIRTIEGDSDYIQIDHETGLITLSDEFDIRATYIIVDIYVKYGVAGGAGSRLIDSVRVYFSQPENSKLTISSNTSQLPKIVNQDDPSSFYVSVKDILQMISISDGSNVWSGDEILNVFSVSVGLYSDLSQGTDGNYEYTWITNPGGFRTILSLDDSPINVISGNDSFNLVVQLDRNAVTQTLSLTNIKMVNSRYSSNSMVSSSLYEYYGAFEPGLIFNSLLPNLAVRNIYGYTDYGSKIFNLDGGVDYYETLQNSKNLQYRLVSTRGLITTIEYVVGENLSSYNSIIYGTITINIYSDADTIIGEKNGIVLSPGESTGNIINSDYFDFGAMPVYGYIRETDETSMITQYHIYIDKEVINSNLTETDSIYLYRNGNSVGNATLSGGQSTLNGYSFSIDSSGIKMTLPSGEYTNYINDIFTIVALNISSETLFTYSFLFDNIPFNASEEQSLSTYSTQYQDIFTLLADINGIDEDDIYVNVANNNNSEYVSLINNAGNYSLILNDISSESPIPDSIDIIIEFYITIYNTLESTQQNIVLYRNNLNIQINRAQD